MDIDGARELARVVAVALAGAALAAAAAFTPWYEPGPAGTTAVVDVRPPAAAAPASQR